MDQPLQRTSVAEPFDGDSPPAINLKDPSLYINRELSWLEFNQRVLAQAQDAGQPLLERVKFLAITGTNLDEFFMIRVATTMRRFRAGVEEVAPDGYTTGQQLEAMRSCAHVMLDAVAAAWTTLRGLLEREQIRLLDPSSWTPEIHEYVNGYFSRDICPVLTPLAFDPGHPFPFISNLSMNFAVVVRHGGRIKFARVKVPDVLPRFVSLPESLGHGPHTFVFLEDVIRANIHELFPGTQVHGAHLFRIVRDAGYRGYVPIETLGPGDAREKVRRFLDEVRAALA